MTVMDFGCGMGWFAIPMARMVGPQGQVIAVDVQPKMLEVLGRRADRAAVADRVRIHGSEPGRIDLQVPCDFILAFWALHETAEPAAILAEMASCLRSAGCLLLVEPRLHVSGKWFRRMAATAQDLGLRPSPGPRVRLSRAALLAKD